MPTGILPTQQTPLAQASRARIPFMMVAATYNPDEESIASHIRRVRAHVWRHRNARRALTAKLMSVFQDRESWEAICEGDECAIHDAELVGQEQALRRELETHRSALEVLESEQRDILRATDDQ